MCVRVSIIKDVQARRYAAWERICRIKLPTPFPLSEGSNTGEKESEPEHDGDDTDIGEQLTQIVFDVELTEDEPGMAHKLRSY